MIPAAVQVGQVFGGRPAPTPVSTEGMTWVKATARTYRAGDWPAAVVDRTGAGFEVFFERHRSGLGRFALLLTGDVTAAEDLTSDVFLAVWRQWDTIARLEAQLPYVRRMMVNTAVSRSRSFAREQRRIALSRVGESETVRDPDGAVSVDVRKALLRLPVRRRACVVLRHAFDLSEAEAADALGVSVGTVKSQTSKGMAQLHALLSGPGRDSGWA